MRAAVTLAVGDVIDERYQVERVLGVGGSGAVYAALDLAAGEGPHERVAIKVLSATDGFDDEHRTGLELEFSLLARLNHPNVVSALSIGVTTDNKTSYLVEELVLGPTLQSAQDLLEPADYFWIAHGILEGLAHLHRRGWVHHDIKPANILIAGTENRAPPRSWIPKIADLGVASMRDSDPGGMVSGTIPFLSPERLVGQLADPRCDVWALGMSLLSSISGTVPVDASSVQGAAKILRLGPVPALRDLRPDSPPELEQVIGRMLARDRSARYRDATDALASLRRAMARAGHDVPELPAESLAQTPKLIARDQVVASVLRRLEPTSRRRARVIAVRGEPGSGRSRLLREIALEAQLRGARAVFVKAGFGLAPWQNALNRLGGPSGSDGIEETIASLLDSLEEKAAVFLVDDVDARDSVAHRLLERLRWSLRPFDHLAGIVVAGGAAHDWSDIEPDEDTFTLEPFTPSESEALISSALGDDVSPQVIARLAEIGGGVPGRIVSAMTSAVRAGAIERVAGVWELTDLATLDGDDIDSYREAIASLRDTSRRLLLALGVLGPAGAPIDLELAREVADCERQRFHKRLTALCHLGLAGLTGTGDPSATQVALMGRVGRLALEGCEPGMLAELHSRAWNAHVRRGTDDASILARHAWGAGRDAVAAELTCSAAESALAARDFASTLAITDHIDGDRLSQVGQAIANRIWNARADAQVELSEPLDGAKLAATVLASDSDNLHAAQVIVRAAVFAGDAARAGRALAVVAEITARIGDEAADVVELAALSVEVARVNRHEAEVESAAKHALSKISEVRSATSSGPEFERLERARGRVLTAYGATLALGGSIETGRPLLEEAREIYMSISDHARIAEASAFLAAAADLEGQAEERAIHLRVGLESAERAGADSSAARLLNIRGLSLLWRGRTEDSIEAFEEAERRARRPGLYRVVSAVSGNLVVVHRRAGQFSKALEAAQRSLRVKVPFGDQPGILATLLNLSDVYFDLGALSLSVAAARRVVRQAISIGNSRIEINGRVTLAIALASEGSVAEARELFADVIAQTEHLEHQVKLEVELSRAFILSNERNISEASKLYARIEETAKERDEPYMAAVAAFRRGTLLGDVGARELRRSIDLASQCFAPHLLWRARGRLGMILRGNDRAGAGAQFARASESLDTVLSQVPSRHMAGFLGSDDRSRLIEAIRDGAKFEKPKPRKAQSSQSTSHTTVVSASSESNVVADTQFSPSHDTQLDQDTEIELLGDMDTLAATDNPTKE